MNEPHQFNSHEEFVRASDLVMEKILSGELQIELPAKLGEACIIAVFGDTGAQLQVTTITEVGEVLNYAAANAPTAELRSSANECLETIRKIAASTADVVPVVAVGLLRGQALYRCGQVVRVLIPPGASAAPGGDA